MYLKTLSLVNFKNFDARFLEPRGSALDAARAGAGRSRGPRGLHRGRRDRLRDLRQRLAAPARHAVSRHRPCARARATPRTTARRAPLTAAARAAPAPAAAAS